MTPQTAEAPSAGKGLHIGLWVVQVLLGLAFLMAGLGKATQPIAELGTNMPWALVIPEALVRFIGVSELLGGVGLILPSATRIQPKLSGFAAVGLAIIMVLAAGLHATRGEYPGIGVNVVLGGLAIFVAWGRLLKAPIAPRGS